MTTAESDADRGSDPDADLDLTPRPAPPAGSRSATRRWGAIVLVLVVVAGAGFVMVKGLTDASLFFYNADEAVDQRDTLGTDRFRLQGTVEIGSVVDTPTGVEFTVVFNGVGVDVEHVGAPPSLFEEGTPVVLEGRWAGDVYSSDQILVKHDEVYVEDNGERLDQAEDGGDVAPRGEGSEP